MALLPAAIEAMFARRCDYGIVQLISSRKCSRSGVKLVQISRPYQVCDGHFRWTGPQTERDLTDCLTPAPPDTSHRT